MKAGFYKKEFFYLQNGRPTEIYKLSADTSVSPFL